MKSFDADDNEILSLAERTDVTEMELCNESISSLTGIRYFPELVRLDCSYNSISALDLSQNRALTEVDCDNNGLESLNVSGLTGLTELRCSFNALKTLDVSQNPELQGLYCISNELTELNVSGNASLISLTCYNNYLSALDLSRNPDLEELDCSYNQIRTLLLPGSGSSLERIDCSHNHLTCLDLSGCASLDSEDGCYLYGNEYAVFAPEGYLDLSALPGFNIRKASSWYGASVSGSRLIPDDLEAGVHYVTYEYDCGAGITEEFTIYLTTDDADMLVIPDGVRRIEAGAFEGTDCEAVFVPAGCVSIGSQAFANCGRLLRVYVPVSTEVADDAFAGCGEEPDICTY